MEGIGMVELIHKNMRVLINALPDSAPDHLDGTAGICESWNQRLDLWDVRLPSGEIEPMHPRRLVQHTDEAREAPAGQHQAQREDVPRAPPEGRVVLNCRSVGHAFAGAHGGDSSFFWIGVRRAIEYYAAQGVMVHMVIKQGDWELLKDLPGSPLRRELTVGPSDDRIGIELVAGLWTLNKAIRDRCQAIDNASKETWGKRAHAAPRAGLCRSSEEFMQQVRDHVVKFDFNADGEFTPERPPNVWP